MGRPALQKWETPEGAKHATLQVTLLQQLRFIAQQHDFPFVMAVHEETLLADDMGLITLKGSNSDCRSVRSLRYGSNRELMTKMGDTEFDEISSYSDFMDGKIRYYQVGEVSNFPQYQVLPIPDEDVLLTYRYRRGNLVVTELPDEWAHVLVAHVELDLMPEAKPFNIAQQYLMRMIDSYPESDDLDPIRTDPVWRKRNRERNALHGY